MKKKINLKDTETDEIIASINLLTIDWYNELIETWEYFLENIDGDLDDFVEYVNETTSIKIEKC
jgi:hypothetical protein